MNKQQGLSLIELMISITLGLVLMAGVVQMFLSSRAVFSSQQGISRSQETGRLAIDFIARDVRMAGFYGCFTPIKDITNPSNPLNLGNGGLSINGLHYQFDEGIMGYNNVASLPHGAPADLGVAAGLVAPNESILVTRGANKVGVIVRAASTANNVFGYSTDSLVNGCVGNLCANQVAVVNDCLKARVFKISALSIAAQTLSLAHSDNWIPTDQMELYVEGEILPMNTNVYFVAQGANGNNSLWLKTNDQPAMELLEGVQRFVVTYSTGGDFVLAAAVAPSAWHDVQAVRVEILVRSADNNAVKEPQPYIFQGVTITPPSSPTKDLHMYQVFSSTYAIRSRVN